jgi:nicotinamide-nucleotide adenylyltransferase
MALTLKDADGNSRLELEMAFPSRQHISQILQRVHSAGSVQLLYSSHPQWPLVDFSSNRLLQVSVLDSSFNPPTLAHLALAKVDAVSGISSAFDARLLLLSVRNADKLLKPGDATLEQRAEMMVILAKEMESLSLPNVAVAAIDEPIFIGKSSALLNFLRHRTQDPHISFQLSFVLGIDTLERLFAARYYSSDHHMHGAISRFLSSDGDNSRIVCVSRQSNGSVNQIPDAALPYVESSQVLLLDLDPSTRSISSSAVRSKLHNADPTYTEMLPRGIVEYIREHAVYTAKRLD